MPELPEVETTCCGIKPHILHQTIQSVIVRQSQLRQKIPANINLELKNAYVTAICRRAKYLLVYTNKTNLIIHLGMSGRFCFLKSSVPANKHDHVDIVFKQGGILRYTDPRRFGLILLSKEDPKEHPLLKHLGIEPLTRQFSGEYLFQQALYKKYTVKQLLMDPKIVVGIGNIYANESLFKTKISPIRPAPSLTQSECQALVKNIKIILKQAIQKGGTTLKDFLSGAGKPGYFSQSLKVYGKKEKNCSYCQSPIQFIYINQRSTFYCKKCQN